MPFRQSPPTSLANSRLIKEFKYALTPVVAFVASTDAGRLAFLGYDASGFADEQIVLLPNAELLKNTRPLKSASR